MQLLPVLQSIARSSLRTLFTEMGGDGDAEVLEHGEADLAMHVVDELLRTSTYSVPQLPFFLLSNRPIKGKDPVALGELFGAMHVLHEGAFGAPDVCLVAVLVTLDMQARNVPTTDIYRPPILVV